MILIDRRVNINPVTVCTTAAMNNAFCVGDPGVPMLLAASAFGAQLTMNPSCNWNCGPCGTIVTDGGDGLPVELMDFSIETASQPEEPEP